MAFQLELGITELAHFGNVETLHFGLGGSPLAYHGIDDHVHDKTHGEHHTDQRGHAEELRHKLAGIAVEQASHRTVDAIPRPAVVALAIGKQTHRDDTPQTVGAVN